MVCNVACARQPSQYFDNRDWLVRVRHGNSPVARRAGAVKLTDRCACSPSLSPAALRRQRFLPRLMRHTIFGLSSGRLYLVSHFSRYVALRSAVRGYRTQCVRASPRTGVFNIERCRGQRRKESVGRSIFQDDSRTSIVVEPSCVRMTGVQTIVRENRLCSSPDHQKDSMYHVVFKAL